MGALGLFPSGYSTKSVEPQLSGMVELSSTDVLPNTGNHETVFSILPSAPPGSTIWEICSSFFFLSFFFFQERCWFWITSLLLPKAPVMTRWFQCLITLRHWIYLKSSAGAEGLSLGFTALILLDCTCCLYCKRTGYFYIFSQQELVICLLAQGVSELEPMQLVLCPLG